jgi:heme/copper-type cytochrome/quinol oxidase subunit 3
MWRAEPERYTGRVAVARLYWNFVDAVWIALFVVLYLL